MTEDITNYPLYAFLEEIIRTFDQKGLLLLSAEPGAGKTTLLPWKLLSHPSFSQGKILLLEPRRLAARAAAIRIASLLGEKIGQTVGIRTRLETLVSAQTRLEVVTEGVLTRLLQQDPSLQDYNAILFDEFHTRSLQGDLGLALAWDTRKVFRPDLKIAILSATLPADEIRKVFGPLPLVAVPGRAHPVEVLHCPKSSQHEKSWDAAARLARKALDIFKKPHYGTVLCFLPGYAEMNRARKILCDGLPDMQNKIFLLHGQMPPEKQHEVLAPGKTAANRVILSTNVAETSLTIPDVKAVVDIGLERRVLFSPRTGMDHWVTLPVSLASAEQRKGRAGRTGPGVCFRWWNKSDFREKFSPPQILGADLAPLALETALWGSASPWELAWLTLPPKAALKRAVTLLKELELLDHDGKITPSGRETANLSIHPRLAKMVQDARAAKLTDTAVVMAALLENEDILSGIDPDFRDRVSAFSAWAKGENRKINANIMQRVWEDARRILRTLGKRVNSAARLAVDPEATGTLLLSAFPDRAAKRTRLDDPVTSRWLLASGRGAVMKGALSGEEFLAVAELDGGDQDARIFLAAPVSRKNLETGKAGNPCEAWTLAWHGWRPQAKLEIKLGAMVLKEQGNRFPPPDVLREAALSRLQNKGLAELPWNEGSQSFLARCRFVEKEGQRAGWPHFAEGKLLEEMGSWLIPFGKWDGSAVWNEQSVFSALENYLGWNRRKLLDKLAPERLSLPSGSIKRLDYKTGEAPILSARLQEFYGCATTPQVCGRPLLLDLLSPAGRTVQLTRDLDGFWDRAYPEVKKELMGRYPRHYWPDNPREAAATARAKRKA